MKEVDMAAGSTGDSPHAVAYQLLERIVEIEGKSLYAPSPEITRKYVLDTYRECLDAVIGNDGKSRSFAT